MNVKEVSELYGISPGMVRRWAARLGVKKVKNGKQGGVEYYFNGDDVRAIAVRNTPERRGRKKKQIPAGLLAGLCEKIGLKAAKKND